MSSDVVSGWGSSFISSVVEEENTSKPVPIDNNVSNQNTSSISSGWGSSFISTEPTTTAPQQPVLPEEDTTASDATVTSDAIYAVPSADVDTRSTEEYIAETEGRDSFDPSYRSGFDRTRAAIERSYTAKNTPWFGMGDEEVVEWGKTVSEAITEVDERGLSKLSPIRGVSLEDKLIADFAKTSGGAAFLNHLVSALDVGGSFALDTFESVLENLADETVTQFLPFGDLLKDKAYKIVEQGVNELRGVSGIDSPADIADLVGEAAMGSLDFTETLPAVGMVSTLLSVRNLAPKIQAKSGVAANKKKAELLRQAIRDNVAGGEMATREALRNANILAKQIAEENKEIRDGLILEYEARSNSKISREVNGHLVIDMDLAKESAAENLREPIKAVVDDGDVDIVEDPLAKLIGVEEGLLSPVLNPRKLDALTAVVADYKAKMKEAGRVDIFSVKGKPPIRAILEATVMKDLDATSELIDTLNKYNLNLEEFILGSVGSFSEAGKVLNVASQLKRVKPAGDMAEARKKKILEAEANIANASQRLENVRRGALVSQVATAMRNLESGGIRMGLESLMNVIDAVTKSFNAPITLGKDATGGIVGASKTLFSRETWKDSFGSYRLAFSRPDVAEGYMKLILDNPQFASQYSKMYDNLNEIQKATGRGEGGVKDKILSPLEDTVEMMNFANRWQENLVRNSVALNEIERLVKQEYGIDLIDAIQEGKLPDLMKDATTVRPKNARSFSAIVADATDKALRVTYASQPENDMFATLTNFMTSKKIFGAIPLTTIVEFPRFMFSSMEFMAESALGIASPNRGFETMRKLIGLSKEPLTPKQHRAVQRNMVGLAVIGAAYLYRSSENAPERYEDVRILGKDSDTTTQFPVRQFLWIGEALKRIKEGTFDMWFDWKDASETFLGSAFRTGTGNIIIEEVASIVDGLDVSAGTKGAEIAGEALSGYLSGYFNFFSQLPAFQRGVPTDLEGTSTYRPNVYLQDPQPAAKTPQEAFMREISRGFTRTGIGRSAAEERGMETKVTVFPQDAIRPDAGWKTLLGISLKDQDTEDAEFVTSLGIPKWKIGSNSDIDAVKMYENEKISKFIPRMVEMLRYRQDKLRNKYYSQPAAVREKITEEQYVLRSSRNLFESSLSNFKSYLRSVSPAVADRYSLASSNYSKVPKKFRSEAYIKFVEMDTADKPAGKEPDMTVAKDLETLTILAKELQKISKKIVTFK